MNTSIALRLCTGLLASTALIAAVGGCAFSPASEVRRERAVNALKRGALDEADHELAAAAATNPTDWETLHLIGKLRLRQNKNYDAQIELERAATHHYPPGGPGLAEILDDLAEAFVRQGKPEPLRRMLRDAIDRYHGTRDYIRQGRCLAKINDIDGAELAFIQAQRVAAPDDASPFLAQADFYDSVRNPAKALTALRQAYYLRSDDDTIAERLRKRGVMPGPTAGLKPQQPE